MCIMHFLSSLFVIYSLLFLIKFSPHSVFNLLATLSFPYVFNNILYRPCPSPPSNPILSICNICTTLFWTFPTQNWTLCTLSLLPILLANLFCQITAAHILTGFSSFSLFLSSEIWEAQVPLCVASEYSLTDDSRRRKNKFEEEGPTQHTTLQRPRAIWNAKDVFLYNS